MSDADSPRRRTDDAPSDTDLLRAVAGRVASMVAASPARAFSTKATGARDAGDRLLISAASEKDRAWIARQLAHALQAIAVELGFTQVDVEVEAA